jgi:hypothetical protein
MSRREDAVRRSQAPRAGDRGISDTANTGAPKPIPGARLSREGRIASIEAKRMRAIRVGALALAIAVLGMICRVPLAGLLLFGITSMIVSLHSCWCSRSVCCGSCSASSMRPQAHHRRRLPACRWCASLSSCSQRSSWDDSSGWPSRSSAFPSLPRPTASKGSPTVRRY